MDRTQKEQFIETMKADLAKSVGVLFVDYTGLSVNDVNSVRAKFREAGVGYRVVKNTLVARAMEGTSYEDAAVHLKGSPTGLVLGYDDPVSAAKITYDLMKEFEVIKVKGGILDEKAIDTVQAEALSKMPNKAELQAGIVGLALSPASNLIALVKGPAGQIVGQIDKFIETKEG